MKRSIVVVLDVDDTAHDQLAITTQDLEAGLHARLDEFYPTEADVVVPDNVRISVETPQAVDVFLSAADVGLEGAVDAEQDEQAVTAAGRIVDALRPAADHNEM